MGISEDDIAKYIPDIQENFNVLLGPFRTRIFRVSELMDMLSSKKLRMIGGKPFNTWSNRHKSHFIESLLLGLPSDPIIIDGADSPWYVADGAELLSTLYEYIHDQFPLDSVTFNVEYKGALFNGLSLMMRSRLLNLQITATIITPDASNIHRLSVYSTALMKTGKENELWRCAEAVYGTSFKVLYELSNECKVNSPHILLQIIIAILYADIFKTGVLERHPELVNLRFDIFECLATGSLDKMLQNIRPILIYQREAIIDISKIIEENKGDLSSSSGKKQTIFIIAAILLKINSIEVDKSKIISMFNQAWTHSEGTGEGSMTEDYAQKASKIYNYLTR